RPRRGRQSGEPELLSGELRPGDEALELLERDPARHWKEAAVRDRRETLDGNVLGAERETLGNVLRRLHVERLTSTTPHATSRSTPISFQCSISAISRFAYSKTNC